MGEIRESMQSQEKNLATGHFPSKMADIISSRITFKHRNGQSNSYRHDKI